MFEMIAFLFFFFLLPHNVASRDLYHAEGGCWMQVCQISVNFITAKAKISQMNRELKLGKKQIR